MRRRRDKKKKEVEWSGFTIVTEPLPPAPDPDGRAGYIYCACKGKEVRDDECTRCQL